MLVVEHPVLVQVLMRVNTCSRWCVIGVGDWVGEWVGGWVSVGVGAWVGGWVGVRVVCEWVW